MSNTKKLAALCAAGHAGTIYRTQSGRRGVLLIHACLFWVSLTKIHSYKKAGGFPGSVFFR